MKFLSKIAALALSSAALILVFTSLGEASFREAFFSMDTFMTVTAYGRGCREAAEKCKDEIYRLEGKYSRTEPESDIFLINNSQEEALAVDDEEEYILGICRDYYFLTEGTFDITTAIISDLWGFAGDDFKVPEENEIKKSLASAGDKKFDVYDNILEKKKGTKLDLGGVLKGYALQSLLDILKSRRIGRGLINLGGDILVIGREDGIFPWKIYIEDPMNSEDEEISLGELELIDSYILTSGNYRRYFMSDQKRYHHIMDPFTGRPAESGLCSVTVISPVSEDAGIISDILSTALFIMGEEKAVSFWKESKFPFDMIMVTDDKRVLLTEDISGRFKPLKENKYKYEIIK